MASMESSPTRKRTSHPVHAESDAGSYASGGESHGAGKKLVKLEHAPPLEHDHKTERRVATQPAESPTSLRVKEESSHRTKSRHHHHHYRRHRHHRRGSSLTSSSSSSSSSSDDSNSSDDELDNIPDAEERIQKLLNQLAEFEQRRSQRREMIKMLEQRSTLGITFEQAKAILAAEAQTLGSVTKQLETPQSRLDMTNFWRSIAPQRDWKGPTRAR